MFGSLERGLDKVITMLTPSKRRALRDGPRKIKVRARRSSISSSVLYQTQVAVLEMLISSDQHSPNHVFNLHDLNGGKTENPRIWQVGSRELIFSFSLLID